MTKFEHSSIEDDIIKLYNEEKWQDIIKFPHKIGNIPGDSFKFSWVLPSESDLSFIKDITKSYNVHGIASIGCGCGLFEWLLQQYSGLPVLGVEMDKSWWCSKYAPPFFLQNIVFVKESSTALNLSEDYALLFCYFNNGEAFSEYMKNYEGRLIFVIGPEEGQCRVTNPMPLDRKFQENHWTLIGMKKISHSNDCIAVYSRRKVCS